MAVETANLEREVERLRSIVDTPDPTEFINAAVQEARYQNVKWGTEDGGPSAFNQHDDADYVFLIAYLAGGAAKAPEGDWDKKLHRITAVAAAAANWHAEVMKRRASDSPD